MNSKTHWKLTLFINIMLVFTANLIISMTAPIIMLSIIPVNSALMFMSVMQILITSALLVKAKEKYNDDHQ